MKSLLLLLPIFIFSAVYSQTGLTFQEAEENGISIEELDSLYKSALHSDPEKAVFTTEAEQQQMIDSYSEMLIEFGEFIDSKGFKWDKRYRCFNRIYFTPEGKIDYFLYNFNGKPEDQPSAEKQQEFNKLLNEFISTYTFPLKPGVKFAQCSPVTYQP